MVVAEVVHELEVQQQVNGMEQARNGLHDFCTAIEFSCTPSIDSVLQTCEQGHSHLRRLITEEKINFIRKGLVPSTHCNHQHSTANLEALTGTLCGIFRFYLYSRLMWTCCIPCQSPWSGCQRTQLVFSQSQSGSLMLQLVNLSRKGIIIFSVIKCRG